MFIYRVFESLQKNKARFAVAGGWAVALHGAVRGTVDLDIVVVLDKANLSRAETALNQIGLESRLPVSAVDIIQFRNEYIKNRNMLAWRFTNPQNQTEIVDIMINVDLKNLNKVSLQVGPKKIPVLSIDDLIRIKKKAGRPQDLEDVKALEIIRK